MTHPARFVITQKTFCKRQPGSTSSRPIGGSAAAVVGADRIRPQHKAPLWGACVPGRLLVDPYKAYAFIRVLPEIRGCGRILSAPTRRMRSSGYFLKSGVSGGFYPPLQSVCEPVSGQYRTGRVREPMYWYKPCALLSGGTAARADSIRPYNPCGRLAPFNGLLYCGTGRGDCSSTPAKINFVNSVCFLHSS